MAHQIHQVGRVLAIMNEGRIDPDTPGVFAQKPRTDAMEGAGPGKTRR